MQNAGTRHPHIWTGHRKHSKIWIWREGSILCRKACGWIAPNLSTERPRAVEGAGPISRRESGDASQIYGLQRDIHIIHSPYYYYESHILFMNNLENKRYILYNETERLIKIFIKGKALCSGGSDGCD
jgi:hypothetical protein